MHVLSAFHTVLCFAWQETNESFVTQLTGQSLYWMNSIQNQPKNSTQRQLKNGRAVLRCDSLLTTFWMFIIPTPSDSSTQRKVSLLGPLDPERKEYYNPLKCQELFTQWHSATNLQQHHCENLKYCKTTIHSWEFSHCSGIKWKGLQSSSLCNQAA